MSSELPTKWQFRFSANKWWRVGAWLFVDLAWPMVSIHVLWWTVGFGCMLDRKAWKAQVGAAIRSDNEPARQAEPGEAMEAAADGD